MEFNTLLTVENVTWTLAISSILMIIKSVMNLSEKSEKIGE